jgi:hypothetical protein
MAMSNRDHYREHPVRTSLQSHLGRSASDPDVVSRLAADAYHQGRGVFFTAEQLAAMPWQSRSLIESEARRYYGPKRGGR